MTESVEIQSHSDPAEMPPRPLSRWPIFFGTLAIVMGVLGLLYRMVTAFGQYNLSRANQEVFLQKSGGVDSDESDLEDVVGIMAEMAPTRVIIDCVLIALAIVLIVGGILLLLRRRSVNWILQTWSVLKILFAVTSSYLGFLVNREILAGVFKSSSSGAAESDLALNIVQWLQFGFSSLWYATLPVIFLIWLNRQAIKDDMASQTWK